MSEVLKYERNTARQLLVNPVSRGECERFQAIEVQLGDGAAKTVANELVLRKEFVH